MHKWINGRLTGIQYYEHPSRKYTATKLDRYYRGRFKVDCKTYYATFGWWSEGWNEEEVFKKLQEFKRNAKTGTGPLSLKEERQILEAAKKEQEAERLIHEAQNMALSKFFYQTYAPHAMAEKSERSWHREESLFRLWISPVIGSLPFSSISSFHLERIRKNMLEGKCAPRSVQYAFATIRQVFNYANSIDATDIASPTKGIRWPKFDNRRMRFLDRTEANALLEALKPRSLQTYEIALLSLMTGMRAGEIFSLTWGQLDLTKGTLFIPGNKSKSKKGRTVYLNDDTKSMLIQKKPGSPSELIFMNKKGQQLTEVSNVFMRVLTELGLNDGREHSHDRIVFHSLRHTFASWLVQDGLDLYTLQTLLGHSSFSMVQRYAHLTENAGRDAVMKLSTSGYHEPSLPNQEIPINIATKSTR